MLANVDAGDQSASLVFFRHYVTIHVTFLNRNTLPRYLASIEEYVGFSEGVRKIENSQIVRKLFSTVFGVFMFSVTLDLNYFF